MGLLKLATNATPIALAAVERRALSDVLKVLLPMLETNETLRKHQEQHKARFKHYREAYAEYMIDTYFKTLPEDQQ